MFSRTTVGFLVLMCVLATAGHADTTLSSPPNGSSRTSAENVIGTGASSVGGSMRFEWIRTLGSLTNTEVRGFKLVTMQPLGPNYPGFYWQGTIKSGNWPVSPIYGGVYAGNYIAKISNDPLGSTGDHSVTPAPPGF